MVRVEVEDDDRSNDGVDENGADLRFFSIFWESEVRCSQTLNGT